MKYKSYKDDVLKAIAQKNMAGLTAVGELIKGEAVLRAPVGETGNLRDSIDYEPNTSDKSVVIGTNTHYALWVEKGTSRMSAQPFLQPAAESNLARAKQLFQEVAKL